MNFNKPMFALHPEWIDEVKKGVCPFCKNKVVTSGMSDIELREVDVSGACRNCQEEMFACGGIVIEAH